MLPRLGLHVVSNFLANAALEILVDCGQSVHESQ